MLGTLFDTLMLFILQLVVAVMKTVLLMKDATILNAKGFVLCQELVDQMPDVKQSVIDLTVLACQVILEMLKLNVAQVSAFPVC